MPPPSREISDSLLCLQLDRADFRTRLVLNHTSCQVLIHPLPVLLKSTVIANLEAYILLSLQAALKDENATCPHSGDVL